MDILSVSRRAMAGASFFRSVARWAAYAVAAGTGLALLTLASCGGGDGTSSMVNFSPFATAAVCTGAISNATGKWVTVVNNGYSPPGAADMNFFSFNQPSVNGNGELVFRGRARTSGTSGSQPLRGVWKVNLCTSSGMKAVATTTTPVPDPNNQVDPTTGAPAPAVFNETPSIPRIDISSSLLGTRGNSPPVWTYTDPVTGLETKAGTTGIFFQANGPLTTGVDNMGNVPGFSQFQVPGAPAGTKFDVFPGSPSFANGKYIAFKGNYTVPAPTPTDPAATASKTGVYVRDVSRTDNPVVLIADSNTMIPGQTVPFGSTAPPSAADGEMVFTGLDNEGAPTMGGIYMAKLLPDPAASVPVLGTVVKIGDPVPGRDGNALADGSTFTAFGEGLSFDGRHISFWAAWGTQMRDVTLTCPTEGNKDVIAYCNQLYAPNGTTTVQVPVNQGIFVQDTGTGKTVMVARAGLNQPFLDFLYWNFSGRAPGTGDATGELARWRSSAFSAVDGKRGAVFKGSRSPIPNISVPSSGIYAVVMTGGVPADEVPVVEVGDLANKVDPAAPADSTVLSVAIEREGLRNGWLTLSLSSINPAGEAWAGVYVTHVSTLDKFPSLN